MKKIIKFFLKRLPFIDGFHHHIKIKQSNSFLFRNRYKNCGNNNTISLGKSCIFKRCKFIFKGSNNAIDIGDNCFFNKVTFYIENDNNTIKIFDNCIFTGECELATMEGTTIEIGKKCLVSSKVRICTGDSHSVCDLDGFRLNFSKNISIGNHVWVGTNVYVNKGSTVGDNCVISSCSLINKGFDCTNCVIGGIPAKVIKEKISWNIDRI